MTRKAIYLLAAFCGWLWIMGSSRDTLTAHAPVVEYYQLKIPDSLPPPVYDFKKNPLTKEGIALGRHLFYDPKLSLDSSVSCGFCHQQFAAFGHFDHALSHGVLGRTGVRSVPTLFNLIWQKDFMWDGGVNHLDIQPLTPITDENEMGMDMRELITRLQGNKTYKGLFKAAYGSEEVTTERMFRALSQFMAIMLSFESKYDSVMRKEPGVKFTAEEEGGHRTFMQKCASCHKPPLFTDYSLRNNGLPYLPSMNDVGRMRITNNTADYLKFKVPSLRNVLVSAPYMHDGRFFDIFQVFDMYDHGQEKGNTIDPLVKNGIPLNAKEQRQLYMFLNTLTDKNFIKNQDFSEVLITD
ncbi:cytochrome-c peroxidase [Chitinophaga rhizophila]|uniref:Cytochrome-c peroxidase n=1 Tax=Chitinophaga rhizophila TaxID=2866212 RepID=A0ABS7G8H9_9BACT|nr:cytochrome-c peroxidase [Chitinophaga rhizophila]MBW8683949.1 cytochrome-c peroxidase [Chitinophaga rhizophila]